MLKRYIGPNDEVRVVVAGTEIGVVKKGDAIAISEELAKSVEWSEDLWADDAPKPEAKKVNK
jgi:hypothetical protein